ncbi:MAG TPA: site-specific integrase [Iamia sp.]|nr:site-specific integrase [Iamia sp.]HXH57122.1 site-specific integrase [Iamia sp.]
MQRSFHQLEKTAWTADQLRTFLAVAAGHRLFPALWLAANTGVRRSELLGLCWSDINFTKARLSIIRGLVAVGYELHESRGKTKNSRRSIDLDPTTLTVLRGWQAFQAATCTATGAENPERIFAEADGNPIHPQTVSQAFDRIVRRLDVPIISLHELRHTHGTLLIEAGIPVKVVSERLGHASPTFTIQTYQHVLPGMQAKAASTFEALISPAVPPAARSTGSGRRNTRRKIA